MRICAPADYKFKIAGGEIYIYIFFFAVESLVPTETVIVQKKRYIEPKKKKKNWAMKQSQVVRLYGLNAGRIDDDDDLIF